MSSAREQIRAMARSGDTFDQPARRLRELQLEAAREAFAAHRERIPLLRTRADECGIREIERPDDLVPLLFSHTSYKSYPSPSSPAAGGTGSCAGTRRCRWSSRETSTSRA
ncbi:hypothetical protein N7U49_02110 [Streptomyces sp. AD2-2]|nr:hypothetical protein N7U49_02110 [Streptomyces sp. AD2-2]